MQAREAGMRLGIGAYAVIIRLTSLRSALGRVLVSTSKRHPRMSSLEYISV